jgi:spore coat polysaccharide biosynthesis protein SpsF (cytidylyltransferase family)
MKIVAVIQARTSSTRLPGKVLLEAVGKPLILLMLERVSRSKLIDELWLATSDDESDDALSGVVEQAGYLVFRGSLNHVLSRYWLIARRSGADVIVRLTGDCPLHDPDVIDAVVRYYLEKRDEKDYVSNVFPATFPDGLDTEVFSFTSLDAAYRECQSAFDQEHVTPSIVRKAVRDGREANFEGRPDFSHLRWTVDQPEDYELAKAIFTDLYPPEGEFSWLDIVAWQTKDPSRLRINHMYQRNANLETRNARIERLR